MFHVKPCYGQRMTRLWFAAKRYGYGWYPVTWEGWVVMSVYMLGVVGPIPFLPQFKEQAEFVTLGIYLPFVVLLTIILLWICMAMGEKARWKWGD